MSRAPVWIPSNARIAAIRRWMAALEGGVGPAQTIARQIQAAEGGAQRRPRKEAGANVVYEARPGSLLGADGAARSDWIGFENEYIEAGPRHDTPCDQAVGPGADDHYIYIGLTGFPLRDS